MKVASLIISFLFCLDLGIFELSDLINKVITECQGELMEVKDQHVLTISNAYELKHLSSNVLPYRV